MSIVPFNWGSFLKVYFVRLLWQSIDVIVEVVWSLPLSIGVDFRNVSWVFWKLWNKTKNVVLLELLSGVIDFLILEEYIEQVANSECLA